jgi:hypothetical protein
VSTEYGHVRRRLAAADSPLVFASTGSQYGHLRARRAISDASIADGPRGEQYGHIRARRAAVADARISVGDRGQQYGHLRARRCISRLVGAGKSKTLGDYEAEWALLASLRGEKKRKARRKLEREAARAYFVADVPIVRQVEAIKAIQQAAIVAEGTAHKALLEATSEASIAFARAALDMARKRAEKARQELEEIDLAYVALVMMGH